MHVSIVKGKTVEKGGGFLEIYRNVFVAIMRYGAPLLVCLLVLRCAAPMLTFQREGVLWGSLRRENGESLPIRYWENVIGRGKSCDIRLDFPTVSRNHAVLTRYDDGSWTVTDAESATGLTVNGEPVAIYPLSDGDVVGFGGVELIFSTQATTQIVPLPVNGWRSVANLVLLTLFQFCACIGFLLADPGHDREILLGFSGLAVLQWGLLTLYFLCGRRNFEVETLAFFLTTMGMAVICTVMPGETGKQLVSVALGLLVFMALRWSMHSLERAKHIRYLAAVAGMGLLIVTLLFGEVYYGAKNWLIIGGISLQPSELAKVCFVFVGASTTERLLKKRNLILFIAYTVALCGLLALMNDFGTALVFFVAFLIIAYMRSGSVGTIALACTALLFAAVIGLKIAPHALQRLTTWRQIWQDPFGAGYQQTQALMCIASGGLWGMGIGNGKMRHLFAADSDMVFATVAEEWGLVLAVLCVLCVVLLSLFSLRCAKACRSAFYAIGSCTAMGILLVQTIFNVLGTVDALPLTGVTFPLLSNGGSSMTGVWGLLAFVKAADQREGAVVKRRCHE